MGDCGYFQSARWCAGEDTAGRWPVADSAGSNDCVVWCGSWLCSSCTSCLRSCCSGNCHGSRSYPAGLPTRASGVGCWPAKCASTFISRPQRAKLAALGDAGGPWINLPSREAWTGKLERSSISPFAERDWWSFPGLYAGAELCRWRSQHVQDDKLVVWSQAHWEYEKQASPTVI